jgi:hypothetical protein
VVSDRGADHAGADHDGIVDHRYARRTGARPTEGAWRPRIVSARIDVKIPCVLRVQRLPSRTSLTAPLAVATPVEG